MPTSSGKCFGCNPPSAYGIIVLVSSGKRFGPEEFNKRHRRASFFWEAFRPRSVLPGRVSSCQLLLGSVPKRSYGRNIIVLVSSGKRFGPEAFFKKEYHRASFFWEAFRSRSVLLEKVSSG